MAYEDYKILVDVPSRAPALGFERHAAALTGIVERSEPRFAVGIFGTWGSGKTTLMEAIRSRLDPQRAVTVEFSAWRYEREEHLLIPLLDTVREGLMAWADQHEPAGARAPVAQGGAQPGAGKPLAPAAKPVLKAVKATAVTVSRVMTSLVAGLSFKVGLPGALEVSFEANKALTKASEYDKPGAAGAGKAEAAGQLERSGGQTAGDSAAAQVAARADPRLPQSVYHAAFRALRDAFDRFSEQTNGLRIVVFVDDLDRCLPQGALEVLESMKLFFDLEGFVFVVGLDRAIVERYIDDRYRPSVAGAAPAAGTAGGQQAAGPPPLVRGADYIKKIFQVPFNLARISTTQLNDLLSSIEGSAGLPPAQMQDLRGPVLEHLRYLVTGVTINPREVKRYINAYTVQLKDIQNPDKNVILALQTLAFRQDWEKVQEALYVHGPDFLTLLKEKLADDKTSFEVLDPDLKEIPESFVDYVRYPARPLLDVPNLDEYIFSGAATSTSLGAVFVDISRDMLALRQAVRAADDAGLIVRSTATMKIGEKTAALRNRLADLASYPQAQTLLDDLSKIEQKISANPNPPDLAAHGEELRALVNHAHAALTDLRRRS